MEAVVWHQLGIVAEGQKDWAEAERCYRESLAIKERMDDTAGTARTCNQLAMVAKNTSRFTEAEGWYKRALELIEKINPGGIVQASCYYNLAELLVNYASSSRFAEAQHYAAQGLAINESLDNPVEIWKDFALLAKIADMEGQIEEAQTYRRRERETYAAFAGNRYHIDQQHGQLIADIVAAANDDVQARAKVEAALPQFEANGWHIAGATQRIWASERDWHTLVEDLDRQDALLILRVLETIAEPAKAQDVTPEQVIASLPVAIREAMVKGDQAALQQAFESLSLEEQQAVVAAIQFLQGQENDAESVAEGGE
jgi:tetratricopeptide (TPR) repeat protein